jgi:glycosyltransferase involved in cell wall biosynthesis
MNTRTMRWLMVATHVPASGEGGGMVRYAVEMAAAMSEHPEVELSVLAQRPAGRFFEDLLGDRNRVFTVGLPTTARSVLERSGVGLDAFARPFDVIHGTKHLVPRRCRARRVLTVHDMLPLDRPFDFTRTKRRLLPGPYLASVRDADVLLCVSRATEDRVCSYVPAARPRTAVVPLAASPRLRTVAPIPVARLERRAFALVVADPSPRKNLGLVMRAWVDVARRLPDATLAVAGPPGWGWARGVERRPAGQAGEAIDRLVADGRIVGLGFLSDGELRWCYERATLVLCPSLLEGFGLPALEARELATPVLTSDDPALVETSGASGRHLPSDRPAAWTQAVLEAWSGARPPPRPAGAAGGRTWSNVAQETVDAVRATP